LKIGEVLTQLPIKKNLKRKKEKNFIITPLPETTAIQKQIQEAWLKG